VLCMTARGTFSPVFATQAALPTAMHTVITWGKRLGCWVRTPDGGGLLCLLLLGSVMSVSLWPSNAPASIILACFFSLMGALFVLALRTARKPGG
jgi:hypothetical protein